VKKLFWARVSIEALANKIKTITEFPGDIKFDVSKPEGTPQKLLDVSVIQRLGWNAQTDLEDGLLKTYNRFIRGVQHRS
jgi:GDP-L-fucose synthase